MKKLHDFDEVHDSQMVFRLILKAMSNPLEIVNIKQITNKLFGQYPAFLALALTLIDSKTSFCTTYERELEQDISSLTLGKNTEISDADFVFVSKPELMSELMQKVKCGTLLKPHQSATFIIQIDEKSNSEEKKICLYGPGIKNTAEIIANENVYRTISYRDEMHFEYPEGIDLIFVDTEGNMFAVPRTSRIKEEV